MKLRQLLFFLGLILVAGLLIGQFGQIQKFISTLEKLNIFILILILPLRFLYYRENSKFFASFFAIFKQKTNFKHLFRAVTAMNFVNIIFPSGGISGLSYLRKQVGKDVSSSTITLAQFFYYVLLFIALVASLAVAFVLLLLSNRVIRVSSRVTLVVLFALLVVCIGMLIFIYNKNFTVEAIVIVLRPVNWLLRKSHKQQITDEKVAEFIDQFHDSLFFIQDNWQKLGPSFWHILLMLLFDFASVYVVFLAFGTWINPSVVIAGYTLAQAASLASIITAGVGLFEATMIATFVGLGVSFDLALSVTIVYRSIALWLFVPAGVYLYKHGVIDGD
ncbi:flippase-like domain-containing protein [Candidatus Saccharibacteria bacterium]|nr:flippase-like domain-containing protein [Candidatus Saccharibacteria bacterium]